MPERSDPTSDAEIVRNVLAPEGFERCRAVCVVATPPRCSGIAFVADALQPALRRSERGPCEFLHGLLGSRRACYSSPQLRREIRMLNVKEVALAAAAALVALSSGGCGQRPDHIEITPRKVTIYGVGHTKDISARVLDRKAQPMLEARFNWSSSDPSVAEGSLEGHLLAKKAGHAVLTASSEKLSANIDVTVAELYTIEIVPPGLKLIGPLGTASKLEILGRTSDGRPTPAPRVGWSSETPKIVSVTPDGLVTSVGAGKGKIKARLDELICETDVEVIDKQISRVDLRPEMAILHVGESEKFNVSVYDLTGLLIPDASARYSTPNPELISVSADGRVTAIQKGTASVIASIGPKTATATVLVN